MSKKEPKPIGVEIRCLSNVIRTFIDEGVQANIHPTLTGVEGMTLGFIYRHQDKTITAHDVMARFGISKATASQTLGALEKKGFIVMEVSSIDKRAKAIFLTDKGAEINVRLRAVLTNLNQQIESGFSEEEKETFRSFLSRTRSNLEIDDSQKDEVKKPL